MPAAIRGLYQPEPIESFTQAGTNKLAEIIRAYWIEKGYPGVKVEAFQRECSGAHKGWRGSFTVWAIRSNIGMHGPENRELAA